jgi:hypothetical protein
MARDESSRENLLREATALVERIELVLRSTGSASILSKLNGDQIVAGFRRNGALSIFFGEDPVYQFNAAGELRRAYCDGKLLKAVRGRLVSLQRVRAWNETQLISHEISHGDESALLARMAEYIGELAALIKANAFEVAGQVPPDANVLGRLQLWLATHTHWQIASRPNA